MLSGVKRVALMAAAWLRGYRRYVFVAQWLTCRLLASLVLSARGVADNKIEDVLNRRNVYELKGFQWFVWSGGCIKEDLEAARFVVLCVGAC